MARLRDMRLLWIIFLLLMELRRSHAQLLYERDSGVGSFQNTSATSADTTSNANGASSQLLIEAIGLESSATAPSSGSPSLQTSDSSESTSVAMLSTTELSSSEVDSSKSSLDYTSSPDPSFSTSLATSATSSEVVLSSQSTDALTSSRIDTSSDPTEATSSTSAPSTTSLPYANLVRSSVQITSPSPESTNTISTTVGSFSSNEVQSSSDGPSTTSAFSEDTSDLTSSFETSSATLSALVSNSDTSEGISTSISSSSSATAGAAPLPVLTEESTTASPTPSESTTGRRSSTFPEISTASSQYSDTESPSPGDLTITSSPTPSTSNTETSTITSILSSDAVITSLTDSDSEFTSSPYPSTTDSGTSTTGTESSTTAYSGLAPYASPDSITTSSPDPSSSNTVTMSSELFTDPVTTMFTDSDSEFTSSPYPSTSDSGTSTTGTESSTTAYAGSAPYTNTDSVTTSSPNPSTLDSETSTSTTDLSTNPTAPLITDSSSERASYSYQSTLDTGTLTTNSASSSSEVITGTTSSRDSDSTPSSSPGSSYVDYSTMETKSSSSVFTSLTTYNNPETFSTSSPNPSTVTGETSTTTTDSSSNPIITISTQSNSGFVSFTSSTSWAVSTTTPGQSTTSSVTYRTDIDTTSGEGSIESITEISIISSYLNPEETNYLSSSSPELTSSITSEILQTDSSSADTSPTTIFSSGQYSASNTNEMTLTLTSAFSPVSNLETSQDTLSDLASSTQSLFPTATSQVSSLFTSVATSVATTSERSPFQISGTSLSSGVVTYSATAGVSSSETNRVSEITVSSPNSLMSSGATAASESMSTAVISNALSTSTFMVLGSGSGTTSRPTESFTMTTTPTQQASIETQISSITMSSGNAPSFTLSSFQSTGNIALSSSPETEQSGSETNPQSTVLITQNPPLTSAPTDSLNSVPKATSTTNWLPSNIITESGTINSASPSSFNPDAISTLPQAISPPTPLSQPQGYSIITIGFKEALNYPFLIENPLASAQIFSFLPRLLAYPFSTVPGTVAVHKRNEYNSTYAFSIVPQEETMNPAPLIANIAKQKRLLLYSGDKNSSLEIERKDHNSSSIEFSHIAVAEIVPLIVSGKDYIVSVAVVYYPTEVVDYLQQMILVNTSMVYTNPEPSLDSLANLIDPGIPITGIISSLDGGGSSGGTGSTDGGGSNPSSSTGGSSGNENQNSNNNVSGSLDNSTAEPMTFVITKRMLIFLPIFSFFIMAWIAIGLLLLSRLYKRDRVKRHIKLHEKEWSGDDYYAYYVRKFSESSEFSSFDPEKQLGDPFDDELSSDNMEDNDLIHIGGRLFYSQSTGLTYFVDDAGNFFYAGMNGSLDASTNKTTSSNNGALIGNASIDEYLYENESRNHSIQNAQSVPDSHAIEVDEDGNVVLPISDLEDQQDDNQNTDTIESYNNNQYYKMTGLLTNGHSELHTDPGTTGVADFINPLEGATGTLPISSNGSNPIIQIPAQHEDLEDYYYHLQQQDQGNKQHKASISGSGSEDDVRDYDVDEDDYGDLDYDDDDDDVDDVHVGELDELDEEMYRRLSTISGLHTVSSSSNTYHSILAHQNLKKRQLSDGTSVPSFTHSSSLGGTSFSDNLYATSNSTPSSLANTPYTTHVSVHADHSPQFETPPIVRSKHKVKPKRPKRPSSIISLERSDDILSSDIARAAVESTSRYYKLTSRVDATKYNSTIFWDKGVASTDGAGDIRSRSTSHLNGVQVSDNFEKDGHKRSRKNTKVSKNSTKRFSIANTVSASIKINVKSSHKRSLSSNDVGPRGHTKQDLKNIRISGPLFTENSLGWTSMD